jgi:DNA/RNA-binding domain of Phe-tRNA-synthetase-like protein
MYRSFGTKPADYRPSAEALIRRGLKTGRIPTINTAVDSYNIVSMRWVIPLGGFDIELVDGDITLRPSDGGEEFMPLGTKKYENTYKGEVVYADNSRILTRRWNYRDCDETKITLDTKKLIMFVDGSPEIPLNIIQSALEDLQNTLSRYCGGSYNIEIANREKSTIIIL